MLTLAPQFTRRDVSYSAWKSAQSIKEFAPQYETTGGVITVWGYDGPEVWVAVMYTGEVPAYIIDAGYSQAQNDADKADWQSAYQSNSNKSIDRSLPFSAKTIGSKKLYKRVVGAQYAVPVGTTTLEYVIPYAWVKINVIECVGGEVGDYCSFSIKDTPTGTYTGVPNYLLNQFGYTTNIAPGFYERTSEFDADLYTGMRIVLDYTSLSAKTIGINYILNELKS